MPTTPDATVQPLGQHITNKASQNVIATQLPVAFGRITELAQ